MINEKPPYDSIKINKDTTIETCPKTETYLTKASRENQYLLSFENIAKGWIDAGMNPKYCKNALRVVGGECQPEGSILKQCLIDADKTKKDGMGTNPYQLDTVLPNAGIWIQPGGNKQPPNGLDLNNPCQAAILSHDIFFNQKPIHIKVNLYGALVVIQHVMVNQMDMACLKMMLQWRHPLKKQVNKLIGMVQIKHVIGTVHSVIQIIEEEEYGMVAVIQRIKVLRGHVMVMRNF